MADVKEKENIAEDVGLKSEKIKINYWKIIDLVISSGLFLAVFVVIVRFIWGPERGLFNADWGDSLLWAEATANSGHLLDPDFNYACFLPFGGNLILLPGIWLFGLSLKAQMFGMTLFLILFSALLIWTFKEATDMKWMRVINAATLVLATVSISYKMRELFWGHIIYYSLGCFCLMLLFCLYSLVMKNDKIIVVDSMSVGDYVKLGLFCLALILTAGNGSTILTLASIPFLGGCFAVQMMDPDGFTMSNIRNRKKWLLIFTEVLCTGAGYLLHSILTSGMTAGYQDGNSVFSRTDTWFDHITVLLNDFCIMFGVQPNDSINMFSKDGVMILVEVMFMVILWSATVILLIRYRKISNERTKLFLCSGIIVEALLLLAWVVGVVSGVCWRLAPLVFIFLMLTALLSWELLRAKGTRRWAPVLIVPFAVCAFMAMKETEGIDREIYLHDDYTSAVQYLQDNDLHVGYAEYWTAIRGMVLSGDEVQMGPVNYYADKVEPRTYQSDNDWYVPVDGCNQYFLLMTTDEYNNMKNQGAPYIAEAIRTEQVNNGYYVLIYDHFMLSVPQ